MVSYIYTDNVDFNDLIVGRILKLTSASLQLMIPELTDMCEKKLCAKLDEGECVDISLEVHRFAKSNALKELQEKAWEVMTGNFERVVASKAFLEWSVSELQEYLQEDCLDVENENPVFEAVITWVKHDEATRKASFSRLAENLRLSHCSSVFLKEVVAKEPLMESCHKLLVNVLLGETSGIIQPRGGKRDVEEEEFFDAQTGTTSSLTTEPKETLVILGGTANDTTCWIMEDDGWDLNKDFAMPVPNLNLFAVCLQGQDLYITGGVIGKENQKKCWKVSFPSMQWKRLPDLTIARYDHASVWAGGYLYVLGGRTGPIDHIADVECLDSSQKWRLMYSMPIKVSCCSAVHISGKILICGGQSSWPVNGTGQRENFRSLRILCYNIATQTWPHVASLPFAGDDDLASLVLGNTMYVVDHRWIHDMSFKTDSPKWETLARPRKSTTR